MRVDHYSRQFPNRLRVIRRNAGLKQRQVAEYLGYANAAHVSSWENERVMPNGANLVRLSVLYGRSVRELYPEYYRRVEAAAFGSPQRTNERV